MEKRTTIQVSEELRKELRVLAAQRDTSYQKLLQDMIETFKELNKEKTIISIPIKLSDVIKEKIKKTDFKNISDYVTYILRILMYSEIKVDEKDLQKVKKRLGELGYL